MARETWHWQPDLRRAKLEAVGRNVAINSIDGPEHSITGAYFNHNLRNPQRQSAIEGGNTF